MYCKNCGAYVEENMRFCPDCGQDFTLQNETRELVRFDPMNCSRELEGIIPPLEEMETQYQKVCFYGTQASHAGRETKIIVNCACISAGLLVDCFLVKLFPALVRSDSLFILIWVIVSGFSFLSTRKMIRNLKVKEESSLIRKQDTFREQYAEIYEMIAPVLEKYVPVDYRYSTAVQSISFYFRNMRADTIKEAINLYEEEMHRLRLENTAELVLRENQKQTAMLAFQAFELATMHL